MRWIICILITLVPPAATAAELFGSSPGARTIPLTLRDGKPMLSARVGARSGVMMFDTGSAYPVMLNRDALALAPGHELARGKTASGQDIIVQGHSEDVPSVMIAEMPMELPAPVLSGNFGFTRDGLGADFLGFVGLPAVSRHAFLLDLGRLKLVLSDAGQTGDRAFPRLGPGAIRTDIDFALSEGSLPTWAGWVGSLPVSIDVDTGDGGTFYLDAETRSGLMAAGHLHTDGDGTGRVAGLVFGNATFDGVWLRLVEAGGVEDIRGPGAPVLLRLGARFLADHPSVWNMPAGRITFLRETASHPRPASGAD